MTLENQTRLEYLIEIENKIQNSCMADIHELINLLKKYIKKEKESLQETGLKESPSYDR